MGEKKHDEALEYIADFIQNNQIFNVATSRFWEQGDKNVIRFAEINSHTEWNGDAAVRLCNVTSVTKTKEEIPH